MQIVGAGVFVVNMVLEVGRLVVMVNYWMLVSVVSVLDMHAVVLLRLCIVCKACKVQCVCVCKEDRKQKKRKTKKRDTICERD